MAGSNSINLNPFSHLPDRAGAACTPVGVICAYSLSHLSSQPSENAVPPREKEKEKETEK